MRIILDTSALSYPKELASIDPAVPVVVPAVVFLERSRQLARAGRMEPHAFRQVLEDAGWDIEPFGADQVERAQAHAVDDARWRKLARDCMIAGHLRPGDQLWTANPRDFRQLGVSAAQVVEVNKAL